MTEHNNSNNENTTRPNVLFILIDDMGYKDLSCMGSAFYETPNIDRLTREGMLFTDAYAACPVCSPTRASIMSGKYPARLGLTNYIGLPRHSEWGGEKGKLLSAPYIPYLPTTEISLAKALKNAGYTTWHVGKWHLGDEPYWPGQHGFDVNIGGCHMGHPAGKGHYFQPWQIPTLEAREGDDYLTDRLGDEAADLIQSHNVATPFFLNMCFYSVHAPIQAKSEKIAKYEKKAAEMGLDKIKALIPGEHFPVEHKKHLRVVRRVIQSDPAYAAMIEHLDENVGKILEALDERGLSDNTLIFFTSDNGGLSSAEGSPTCNAPLHEGKGWMYDGGTREPLLVRWPQRIEAGSRSNALVTSPDFYPTILEACGLPMKPKQHCDGRSFISVLNAPERPFDRGSVFWHFPHYANQGGAPGCSIRRGDWKLIEFFGGETELYNLVDDIGEQRNHAKTHPEIRQELQSELHEWLDAVNAITPRPNPDWKPWHDPKLNAEE